MSESPSSHMRVHSEDGHNHGGNGAGQQHKIKTLNRTSRACNNCRKQKMRCIGAEDPPCKRCRNGGLECLFEKPAREGTQVGEERIKQLESQVGSIQSTLSELVSTLKAANSANGIGNPPPPPHQPQQQMIPSYQQSDTLTSSFSPSFYSGNGSTAGGAGGSEALPNMAQYEGSLINIINPTLGSASTSNGRSSSVDAAYPHHSMDSSQPLSYRSHSFNPPLASASTTFPSSSRTHSTAPLSIPDNHPYPLPPPIPSRSASSASHPSSTFVPFQGMNARPSSTTDTHLSPRTDSSSHSGGSLGASSRGVPPPNPLNSVYGRRQLPTQPPSSSTTSYSNLLTQSLYPLARNDLPTSSARTTPAGSEVDENEQMQREEFDFPTRSGLEPLGAMGRLAQAALGDGPREAPTPARLDDDGAAGGASGGGMEGLMLLAVQGAGQPASSTTDGTSKAGPNGSTVDPTTSTASTTTKDAEEFHVRPGKRARFASGEPTDLVSGSGNANFKGPLVGSAGAGLKESHILGGPGMAGGVGGPPAGKDGRILDCIDAGVIGLEEGKELVDIYWQGAFRFLPVYEPERDTFEELRRRSPFSISAMCFVGARIRDGGGTKSDAQIGLWYHVRRISQETLFKTTTRVEAIQATILITGWNEYGWLLAGHAVRLAFELGCHTAFLRLARSGMGAGKAPKQIEEERGLVIMARVWFCLYVIEHQMSYGTGRPPIVREDETIIRCREFLNHPLAIETDLRLIASVEIMSIRAPLHLQLYNLPEEEVVGPETLSRLHQANIDFESWYQEWDRIFETKFGPDNDVFFRQSLKIQKCYAQLFHNCTALREIRGPADVREMVPEQRELAKMALRNAQECLQICLHSNSYRWAFNYAVHYTHVCAAFAATLLIRLARIFPTELDLRQTARDVTELSRILSNVPAGRYARSIRLTLRSARRRKVMPPPSVPSSPSQRNGPLPPAPFSPSSFINPQNGLTQPTPVQSRAGSPVLPSPQIKIGLQESSADDESPQADFSMDFDWGYTADLLDKVGLTVPEGGNVPLWLHGSDIGSSQLPSSGMENFFLPSDLDFRLYSADDLSNGGTGIPPPISGFPSFPGEGDNNIW